MPLGHLPRGLGPAQIGREAIPGIGDVGIAGHDVAGQIGIADPFGAAADAFVHRAEKAAEGQA
jgi:hypothetical protein